MACTRRQGSSPRENWMVMDDIDVDLNASSLPGGSRAWRKTSFFLVLTSTKALTARHIPTAGTSGLRICSAGRRVLCRFQRDPLHEGEVTEFTCTAGGRSASFQPRSRTRSKDELQIRQVDVTIQP